MNILWQRAACFVAYMLLNVSPIFVAHAAAPGPAPLKILQAPFLDVTETPKFSRKGPIRVGNRNVWEYRLVVTETTHRLADGTPYKVYAYGGMVPAPTIVARENDLVRIELVNETTVPHTIHSHGLFVPQRMDGASHSNGMPVEEGAEHAAHHHHEEGAPPPVGPGESFTYEFVARPAGTYFYHCHVNTNEHLARGMAGAFIVLPADPDPPVDHDVVILLQEWNSKYAQSGKPGNPREAGDFDFFTLNAKSFPQTEDLRLNQGERVRMRFIGAGAQQHFMHLHGHSFLVTHKDGFPLREPVVMDTVEVGPGERVDVVFVANNPGDWPLHCHAPSHVTNAGEYPGGMMMHIVIGAERYPKSGSGPLGLGVESLLPIWREHAARFYRHREKLNYAIDG
jgi:manganese oxidase